MSKWLKGSITSVLGAGIASMFFCLPCWVPFLMFMNSLGIAGMLSPEYEWIFKLVPLVITTLVVWRLGSKEQALKALGVAVSAMLFQGAWAVPSYILLGVLLWTARKGVCKI